MRKTSHEIDPSSTSQKSEKIPFLFKPLELQPIKEFISHSKILFTKYQTSSNYQYYRDLGSNIFQALAYIYIEEILHFGTVTYMTSWLEFLRSEESDFFKNLFFQSKMPKKFLEPQNQEIYHKSEAVFFEAFEKYLDALLTNPKDRTYLCYDFYFQCLYSEELRRFCMVLPRKMVSFFYYDNKEIFKKIDSSDLKIWDLEENSFSFNDLKLISNAINFRIDCYQASRNAEMKQELVPFLKKSEPYGKLAIVVFENKYYCFYAINEKMDLHEELRKKYDKMKQIEKKPKRNSDTMEIEKKEEDHQMEIEKDAQKTHKDFDANPQKENSQNENPQIQIEVKNEVIMIQSDDEENNQINAFKENLIEKYRDEEHKSPKSLDLQPSMDLKPSVVSKPKEIKQKCFHCDKLNHTKPLFIIRRCHHTICFECMIDKYYQLNEIKDSHSCPAIRCPCKFCLSDIQSYFQEIQILESQSNAMNIESEGEKLNENQKKEKIQKVEKINGKLENHQKVENNQKVEKNENRSNEKPEKAQKPFSNEKIEKSGKLLNEKIEKSEKQEKSDQKKGEASKNENEEKSRKIEEERPAEMNSEPLKMEEENLPDPNLREKPNKLEATSDKSLKTGNEKNEEIELEEEKSYKNEDKSAKKQEKDLIMGNLFPSPKKGPKSSPKVELSDKNIDPIREKDAMLIESPETESIQNNLNIEPTIICVSCQKSTPQSQVFSNPLCGHCYCYECVLKLFQKNKEYYYCLSKSCIKLIKKTFIEKYLEEYNRNLLENDPGKSKLILQICYNCQKESQIHINQNSEMEFFQCRFCLKSSCLIHKASLTNCFCFCENCAIKTTPDLIRPTRKICVNCRKKYCILCRNPLVKCGCYCNVCEEIIKENVENEGIAEKIEGKKKEKCEKCKNCELACIKCGITLKVEKMVTNEKCGHLFCRECMYEFIDRFRKTQCIFEHSYY